MPFAFNNPWPGGALGRLGAAVEALYAAITESGGEGFINVKHEADGSLTIRHMGRDAKNGWNGKIANSDDPTNYIVDIDVGTESNIQGKYICVDPDTGDHEWSDTPSAVAGWKSFHVADEYQTTPAGFSGSYHLNRNFNGTIINPATVDSGLPPATTLYYVLNVEPNPVDPEELVWVGGPVKALGDE